MPPPRPRLPAILVAAGAAALALLPPGAGGRTVAAQDAPAPPAREGESRVEKEHGREPLPAPEEIARLPRDGGKEFNRLIFESSPYLLQHARNPVDWYPWGDAAFEKARKEDRPVLLSVGYSTCHWCHVMERESFEDGETARILNEQFVAVKVDREERPDVDAAYMAVLQATSGGGGWPLNMFLTPDRRPFTGGTYFPPDDRFGRPGFRTVLLRIAELWKGDRKRIEESVGQLAGVLRRPSRGEGGAELDARTLDAGFDLYDRQFDARRGGFGGAPKFPRAHSLSFLLRYHDRTGNGEALRMAVATLDAIARGGIHDHLGGGFHRYSTDADWLVPHFEKMLYDQALLARAYLEAWLVTGEERHAGAARSAFAYVLRDMTDDDGGFRTAEDADSEGVEGKFYLWTMGEILEVLGKEDGELFASVYGATAGGNHRDEATGEATGANILHLPVPLAEAAARLGTDAASLGSRLAPMRERLLEARSRRVRPHLDDKVLADGNGLMIGSLAFGGRVLGEPRWTEAAARAADFVLREMRRDGRLLHRWRRGRAGIPAFLDDHAFLGLGLLDLYEATFDPRWLAEARGVAAAMDRLFRDREHGGWFLSASDAETVLAPHRDLYDGAVPSGNSAATLLLLRLGRLLQDREMEEHAAAALRAFSGEVARFPMGYPFLLAALDFAVGPTREIVLSGDPASAGMAALRRTVDRRFLPRAVVALRPEGEAAEGIVALVPFLEAQVPVDGKATAFVCTDYACEAPVTDPAALEARLRPRER